MPYIGLAGDYRINDSECNVLFKYSDWQMRMIMTNTGYLRKLTFREKRKIHDIMARLLDGYYIFTSNAKPFAEFAYSKYEEGKGVRKS